jgi:hypothetical protein
MLSPVWMLDVQVTVMVTARPVSKVSPRCYKRYPLANEHWSDKRADVTRIQCPVHLYGSDLFTPWELCEAGRNLHSTTNGSDGALTKDDMSSTASSQPMTSYTKYFNRYLKRIENVWEKDSPN